MIIISNSTLQEENKYTGSDSSGAARNIWLPGTLREALLLSNYTAWSSFRLECHVLISVHIKVSGAGNNLSVTTTSLHLCSSFLQKVKTVMCLREVLVNLQLFVTLSEIFLSKLEGLGHLRVKIIPVKYNLNLKEISYLLI